MTNPNGWVDPIGAGAQPSRIDMGVDYTGNYKLYAMGSGVITNIYNSGWPGGTFIGLHLDSGQFMYYAENIQPTAGLQIGQRVKAGQLLGQAINAYPYTEIGWAAPPGTGNTMASEAGQAATGGDPGAHSTAYGVSMSDTIASLGGPAGQLQAGGIVGSVASGYPSDSSGNSGSGGSTASGCVPLIWLVYYAVCYTKEHRWHVSRRQRRNRRRENEIRVEGGSQETNEASLRDRARVVSFWRQKVKPEALKRNEAVVCCG